jgi:hypothetical protein
VGDDLGGDGDGCLLGGVGAEVEADRGVQAGELVVGYADCAQGVEAVVMGASGAHDADVADREVEGQVQEGDVELGVVGEDADGGAGVDFGVFQVAVGPVDDYFVGVGEAGGGGEDGAVTLLGE